MADDMEPINKILGLEKEFVDMLAFANDMHEVATYLLLSDPEIITGDSDEPLTQEEIASQMGISRSTLWRRINMWTADGRLQRTRTILFAQKREVFAVAVDRALGKWPEMVARLVRIAIAGKSDKNAIDAFATLHDLVILPAFETTQEISNSESDYLKANTNTDFDPGKV